MEAWRPKRGPYPHELRGYPQGAVREAMDLVRQGIDVEGRRELEQVVAVDPARVRVREDGFFIEEGMLSVTFVDAGAVIPPGTSLDREAHFRVADRDGEKACGAHCPTLPFVLRDTLLSLTGEGVSPTLTVRIPFERRGPNCIIRLREAEVEQTCVDPSAVLPFKPEDIPFQTGVLRDTFDVARGLAKTAAAIGFPSTAGIVTTMNRLANRAFTSFLKREVGYALFQQTWEVDSGVLFCDRKEVLLRQDDRPLYAKFNGGMRLFPALVNQRILGAALAGKPQPYTKRDLEGMLPHLNAELKKVAEQKRRNGWRWVAQPLPLR